MNAITMKLENRQLPVPSTKDKPRISIIGKKCKNNRKKSILVNTDKDALLNSHGLGCKSGDSVELNDLKSNISLELNSSKKARSKKISPKPNDKMPPKSEKMQERLEQFLSSDVREKISSILNEVKALSDVEKLFLYLQLPTGASLEVDPFKPKAQNPLGKKADEEGLIAVNWIQSHFEEDPDVSLPKQEVYNEYQSYCQMAGTDSLCAADFGKVMKQIFPSVKPRRLGTRGNSRYCYSGLRKKLKLEVPKLPDMHAETENSEAREETTMDEATSAACHILFQWAEKLLGIKFTSLKSLASHLLENMYVDNRSVAAFTVLLEGSPETLEKGFISCEGGIKKSDAQIHLQRKIQEKELIKEQKKKLQEQRSSLTISGKGKAVGSKRKSLKSKKNKLPSSIELTEFCIDKECNSLPTKSSEGSSEATLLQENINFEIKEEEFELELLPLDSSNKNSTKPEAIIEQPSPDNKTSPHSSPGNFTDIEDNVKKKSTFLISQRKTPVCIAQSLPGIIILPQLSEIGKQNALPPKYKRIQPKPLKGDGFSAVMRARAGSVGSSITNKPKLKSNDGRRSSHAWLQSACSPETSEDITSKNVTTNIKLVSLKSPPIKTTMRRNSFVVPKDMAAEKLNFILGNNLKTTPNGAEMISSNTDGQQSNKILSELILKPGLAGSCKDSSLPSDDNCAIKRHLNESGESVASKRARLDTIRNQEALESFQPWSKTIYHTGNSTTLSKQDASIQQKAIAGEEEVSVHDIEGDALIDYLRGATTNASIIPSLQQIKDKKESEKNQIPCNNKVKQLSQLRQLLEQNLPRRITNVSSVGSLKEIAAPSISTVAQNNIVLSQPVNSAVVSEKSLLQSEVLAPNIQLSLSNLCNSELTPVTISNDKLSSNNPQINVIDRLLSFDFSSHVNANMGEQNEPSDPNVFLNSNKNDSQKLDLSLNSGLSDLKQDLDTSNLSSVLNEIEYANNQMLVSNSGRVNTYTQVPSVPQSPNTRRRAFNFMPISPRHTPVPDSLNNSASSVSSPISNQYPRNMMSIAVGPSQPPSNAGSPFVSPRSTPVSMCRSRHSSGQSTYSTSRHTPFQNFDSGVSSVSSSPFISPQPTPVPVSRLRHNSSHGSSKTVTFCSINNPQIMHTQTTINNMGQLRSRHSSGPGGPHLSGNVCTPRSAPLSPLVSEQCPPSNFVFPSSNEVRSRHNSGSNTTTPLSPVSEQASSSSSCTSNLPDLSSVTETASSLSHSFLNDAAADLLINGNQSNFKQVRQRHASSSVIYNKPYLAMKDTYSPEIQSFLKNGENTRGNLPHSLFNRSQSVPLFQMLQNLDSLCLLPQPLEETIAKSHPTTPVMSQMFSFPLLSSGQENSSTALTNDMLNHEKGLNSSIQMEWVGLDGTGDMEMNSARRNLSNLLDPPLSDDLQTTLEDLRDCDTDFSKFAQELELSQNEDVDLQYEVK